MFFFNFTKIYKKTKLLPPTQIDVVLEAIAKKKTLSLENLINAKNSSINCFDFDQLDQCQQL